MSHPEFEDVYTLSPVQEGMLFHTLYAPGAGTYLDQVVLELAGPLDADALERAWHELVARHPSLRTTFQWEGFEKPVQVVRRPGRGPKPELERLDWSGPGAAAGPAEARLAEWLAADRRRGFDLERGPLLRLALIRWPGGGHRLVWSYHHIVLDAWSGSILFRELFALYAVGGAPAAAALPPAVPYRRYIGWLRRQDADAARAFWRRHLEGLDDPARLPERAPEEGTEPEMAEVELAVDSAALTAFARSRRLTPATLVTGAWALALAVATGARDAVFGVTVSGRPPEVPEVERIVGLLINTLPLRVPVDPDERVEDWLRRLQAAQNEMRRYEHSSLAEIQEGAHDAGLIQTLLAFENVPGAELADEAEDDPSATRVVASRYVFRTHYPLAVQAIPGDRLSLRLVWDRRRLDDAAVLRLSGRFVALLGALPESAERRLRDLPRMDESERHLLEAEWSGRGRCLASARLYPRDRPVSELVAEWCRETPDAVAVVQDGVHLSYAALDRASGELAGRLAAVGVGPESRVGVALPRSPELAVTLLAVLRAGGAYVALDEQYPRAHLAFLAADSGMRALVVRRGAAGGVPADLVAELAEAGVSILDLDEPDESGVPGAGDAARSSASALALAYVAYTSGSTGKPKGVAVSHRGVARLVRGTDYMRFGRDEVYVQTAPIAFDASTFEIWAALANGARLVMAPPGLLSLERLEEQVRRHRVTTLWATTGLFQQIVEERPEILATPRQAVTGGEAGSPGHFERALVAMAPGALLHHAYGPTENTTFSTIDRRVAGRDAVDPGMPIGRPIAHGTAHVVDRSLDTVPVDAPGELVLGGDGVARGYLDRPRETAERFVPDPFAAASGGRLYRSGDLVRMRGDGRIEFVGRIDQQVKIRGFRIEPREVEEALLRHPLVRSAVVAARDDAPGGRGLVAYVVPVPEAERGELNGALLAELREHLPAFAVPGHLVALDAVPLTPQGKVDRAALPAPVPAVAPSGERRPPESPVERAVAEVWSELLGVEEPGLDDDFFESGGHSLLATRLVSRLRRKLSADLPLEVLFRSPTLGAVAGWIARRTPDAGAPASDPGDELTPRLRPAASPLSFAQERLWFLDRLQPGTAAYNVPLAVALGGRLDPAALDAAWSATVRRHEALRTRFVEREGEGRQVALPPRPLHVPRVDLSGLDDPAGERREAEARRLARREAARPFDLAAGEPARATLLRLGPERHVLLLTLHHAVSDGWSLGVLLDEIGAAYRSAVAGLPDERPELPVQYADYAAWQRRRLSGELLERLVDYWRDRLAGAPASLDLPTDRPRPAVQRFRGGAVRLSLPAGPTAALEELASRGRTTLFTVLLAAYATFLARHGRQRDVVVGVPVAGRTRVETEGLIGFFVNTLVLRLDLADDPTFAALVARAREAAQGAQAHQELPFEKLTAELSPDRDLSRNPLFQTLFAFQTTPEPRRDLPGLTLSPLEVEVPVSKLDLELSLAVEDGALVGALTYDADLFDRATARRLARHLTGLLEGIAAGAGGSVSELPMVPAAERHQVLREWGGGPADAPHAVRRDREAQYALLREREAQYALLHEWIAARARETPDRIAVATPEARLGYGELVRRSGALARRLAALGVGPETTVGVALGRSPELIVALLAVLEAGGAYLPLDPSYPAERLAFVLEDSGAAVVLAAPGAAAALPGGEHRVLEWDGAVPETADAGAAPRRTPPEALSHVIYTSGSTGKPKGVAISHASATRFLSWCHAELPAPAWEGVLAATSLAFDLSVFEIFGPLTAGGTVLLAGSALDLLDLPTADRVRMVNTVPSAMRELLAAGALPDAVDHVNLAGEPLPRALVDAVHRARPGVVVRNLYGPSEDTTYSTGERLPAGAAEAPGIGRPVTGTCARVLDEWLRPVPAGVAGELHLGGAGLARGYLRRPALTAERFVPDPLADDGRGGGRFYRTGDLVRHRRDGRLEFLGRIDHQIKSRGFRIEPGEIESVLAGHPAVREAVVVPWEDPGGHRVPVAYVVYEDDLSELRGYLGRQLPAYMVPTVIVPLEGLPLTPSGKVDRRSLPAPNEAAGGDRERVPPRTELERRLAAVWADVLGREEVGVRDSFFELGGHSLLLVRVHSRLRKELDATLSVMELFQYPTIEALARRLESRRGTAGEEEGERFEHAGDRAARKRAALGRRRGGRR